MSIYLGNLKTKEILNRLRVELNEGDFKTGVKLNIGNLAYI